MLEEFVFTDNFYCTLKIIDKNTNVPILLKGGPGTGKTTVARIIAKQFLFGDNKELMECNWKTLLTKVDNILEINISDIKGIKSLSTMIYNFHKKIINDQSISYKLSDYQDTNNLGIINISTSCSDNKDRVVLIDDLDLIDKNQSDICEYIKNYKNILFIFTATNASNILDDIQSLSNIICMIPNILYEKDGKFMMINFIRNIYSREGFTITDNACEMLIDNFNGDFRKLLSNMQSISQIVDENCIDSGEKIIDIDVVSSIYGPSNMEIIMELLEYIKKKELRKAIEYVKVLYLHGYENDDILNNMEKLVKKLRKDNEIDIHQEIKYFDSIYKIKQCQQITKIQIYNMIGSLIKYS